MMSHDVRPAVDAARHARQIALPHVGVEGQARLRRARVLLVGAGGLGSPAALYLAAAGVGHLGLVDPDRVALHNLQRQILHATADVGRPKVESARDRLRALDPHVDVATFDTRLDASNALDIVRGYDVVVDGSDNLRTRYLTSDACVRLGVPNVYGAVFRFEGQATVLAAPDGPCYRCLFPEPPPPGTTPSCEASGVLGVLPGLVGTIQAAEALKLLLGMGEPLVGRLLMVDGLRMDFRTMRVRRNPACSACGPGARRDGPLADEAVDDPCGDALDGGAPGEAVAPEAAEVTPRELAARLARGEAVALVDVREPWEFALARLPGARLVPLGTLDAGALDAGALDETTPDAGAPVVVYCHRGARGRAAVERLRAAGLARVTNLAGGIDRWSADVDPAVPRY